MLFIKDPKNRAHLGRNQASIIRGPGAVAWCRWLLRDLLAGSRLWPFTRQRFGKFLSEVLVFLELGPKLITAGGFRAGRATELFESGVPISTLKYLGRWRAEASMASYIQEAAAASVLLQLPAATEAQLLKQVQRFAFLSAPPPCSAWRLVLAVQP